MKTYTERKERLQYINDETDWTKPKICLPTLFITYVCSYIPRETSKSHSKHRSILNLKRLDGSLVGCLPSAKEFYETLL